MRLAGGYDARFIGVGTDEFRLVLNAGSSLTAAVAILSYATKTDIARGYVVVALPCLTVPDLLARFALRKRLHRRRSLGSCMWSPIAVGHARVVADLAIELRLRETYHGLSVVAACVAGIDGDAEVGGVPVVGGLNNVARVVELYDADTVAVLACPEMSGVRLRELAWELEKTGTDLCVAPALLDVAGPRTTIRPVAGLPLLHVDHPEFTGTKLVIKGAFDKILGISALGCWPRFLLRWPSPSGSPTAGPRCSGRPGWAGTGAAYVHRAEVPHDGAQRRGTTRLSWPAGTSTTEYFSRSAMTRG